MGIHEVSFACRHCIHAQRKRTPIDHGDLRVYFAQESTQGIKKTRDLTAETRYTNKRWTFYCASLKQLPKFARCIKPRRPLQCLYMEPILDHMTQYFFRAKNRAANCWYVAKICRMNRNVNWTSAKYKKRYLVLRYESWAAQLSRCEVFCVLPLYADLPALARTYPMDLDAPSKVVSLCDLLHAFRVQGSGPKARSADSQGHVSHPLLQGRKGRSVRSRFFLLKHWGATMVSQEGADGECSSLPVAFLPTTHTKSLLSWQKNILKMPYSQKIQSATQKNLIFAPFLSTIKEPLQYTQFLRDLTLNCNLFLRRFSIKLWDEDAIFLGFHLADTSFQFLCAQHGYLL